MFSLFKSHSHAPHTIAHLNRAVESISRFWLIVCCFSYSGNVTMLCIFITKTSLIIYNTYTEISEAWQNSSSLAKGYDSGPPSLHPWRI